MSTLHEDYFRYLSKDAMPKFQYFFRKVQNTNSSFLKRIYIRLYNHYAFINHIEYLRKHKLVAVYILDIHMEL